jgi:hypothetical protein
MIKQQIKMKNLFTLGKVVSALFYSLLTVALFYKLKGSFALTTFDRRIISEATIAGIDIASRTSFYNLAIVVGIVSFICFLLLFNLTNNLMIKGFSEFKFEANFFHSMSLFGVIALFFHLIGVQSRIILTLILCFQVLLSFVILLKFLANKFEWNRLLLFLSEKRFVVWLFIQSFVWMFYSAYLGKVFSTYQSHLAVNYFIGFILNFVVTFLFFTLLVKKRKVNEKQAFVYIIVSCIPIFISPIYLPLANEFYLILNQTEILLSPRKLLLIFIALSTIATVGIYFISIRKQVMYSIDSILGKFYYPILLVMFTAIVYQPPEKIGPPIELFESGNPGIAIDQLFRYGKVPLLETFNAHAVSELYAPFLYSIINGYQDYGSFLYNTLFDKTIYFLIAYFFLRKLLSNELALLTLVFFPVSILTNYILPEYYLMGVVAVFALHKVMATASFKSYLLFGFVLSFTFLWRFDIGASAIPSALITLGLYCFLYKRKWHLKKLILAGGLTGAFWFLAFIILAVIKDVPIVFRLKELLAVVSSNQVWGFSTLGDKNKLHYYLFYIILPVLNVVMIGFLVAKTKIIEKMNPVIFTSISFLLFFTLFNFPRGLVRHSLVENTPLFLLGFFAIPIAYLSFLNGTKGSSFHKYVKFSFIGAAYSFVILSTMYGTKIQDNSTSLLSLTIERFTHFTDYIATDTKVNRYDEPEEYKNTVYGGLNDLFMQTMKSNETFIDFSNAPFLYIHTNRETPMYINQTPAFLSDELTQNSFLEEIKSYSIPYVVFADKRGFLGVDGVPNHIRSYRIAEYIYQNYVPFIKINGFDVWVSKSKKSTIEDKLNHLESDTNEMVLYDMNSNRAVNLQNFDNESMKESVNGLTLETGSSDPQIQGFFANAGLEKLPLVENSKYELEIDYSTNRGGNIQVYFLLNNTFTDEDSITIKSGGSLRAGTKKVNIPFSGVLRDIRLDPPSDDTFVIHSIKIIEKTNSYKRLNKSYKENSNIGWVPYLWGEADTLNVKDSAPVQVNITNNQILLPGVKGEFSVAESFEKSKGNFIHIRLKTSLVGEDFEAALEYGEGESELSGAYIFNIKADGKYHDYLIRTSSQYNWLLSKIQYLSITSNQEILIEEMNILKGD